MSTFSQQRQILVRTAGKGDWKKILALYASLDEEDLEYRFFNIHHVYSDEAKEMANPAEHLTLLALDGENAVGEATLQGNGEVSVVVSKGWRGQGIATKLVNELIQAAREKGFTRLKFFSLPSNSHMVSLGRAFGFRVVEHSNVDEEWVLDI